MPARKSTRTALAQVALVRGAAAICLALFLCVGSNAALAETKDISNDASAFIEHLGRRVISLLAEPKKLGKKEIITFRKIFTDALDMKLIAQQVMGRHWRIATEEQKARYNSLFAEYVVQIYARQFSNYSGESFDVFKEQGSASDDRVVKTRVIRDNGEITHVDFRVRKQNNRFRVVDVGVRGVSLLVAKRSEFDAVIRRKGVNGLISQLDGIVGSSGTNGDPVTRLARETYRALEELITFSDDDKKSKKGKKGK